MGADGGYLYVDPDRIGKYLKEDEISLWLRYTRHNPRREVWKEDFDVAKEEEKLNLKGHYRFVYGTDVNEEVGFLSPFANPPEEIWYWRTWMEEAGYLTENHWIGGWGYHWITSPNSWYEVVHGPDHPYQVRLPTPNELDALLSINDRIERDSPFFCLETWT